LLEHPLGQSDFRFKRPTRRRFLGMIVLGLEGQKKILEQHGHKDPLMAEEVGHILAMILMPPATKNLFNRLPGECIIQENEEGFPIGNSQGVTELIQGGLGNLLDHRNTFSQESGEGAEGFPQESGPAATDPPCLPQTGRNHVVPSPKWMKPRAKNENIFKEGLEK